MANSGIIYTNTYNGGSGTKGLCFEWSISQTDTANRSTTINWSIKGYGTSSSWHKTRSIKLVIDGNEVYNQNGTINLKSGDVVSTGTTLLEHNAQGKKSFSASLQGAIYTGGINCSGSGSWSLPDIAVFATLDSAENFTDEENPSITYTNPSGSSVEELTGTISLDFNTDIVRRNLPTDKSSYTFELTDAERETLREKAKDKKSLTVYFYIGTKIAGVDKNWKSISKTCTISNCEPTFSPSIQTIDENSRLLTGNTNTIILGESEVSYEMNAQAYKHATIQTCRAKNGTQEANKQSGLIYQPQTAEFEFYIADSRGYYKETKLTPPVVNYIPLTAVLTVSKPTAEGVIEFEINGQYFNSSFGVAQNSFNKQWRYKENNGEYCKWLPLLENTDFKENQYHTTHKMTGLNYKNSYTIQVRISDNLRVVFSDEITVKCLPVFDWGENDFNLNVPLYYQGKKAAFVCDYGEKDGWTYQLWTNGRLELWQTTIQSLNFDIPWGEVVETIPIKPLTYPYSFKEPPNEQVNAQSKNFSCWLISEGKHNTETTTGQYALGRPASSSSSGEIKLHYYINGYIKEETK